MLPKLCSDALRYCSIFHIYHKDVKKTSRKGLAILCGRYSSPVTDVSAMVIAVYLKAVEWLCRFMLYSGRLQTIYKQWQVGEMI